VSFDFSLLKAIVLLFLRDKQTLVIPGDILILMARNLSNENQNKLDDSLAI